MLELKNVENKVSVSLNICGYQFPEVKTDDWCLVKASIRQSKRTFEKTDPALEASEVFELYSWFKALSENRLPSYSCLSFTEPCLAFEFLSFRNNIVRFAICFSHELKPDFRLNQFNARRNAWNVVFELNQVELLGVVLELERVCKAYPSREKS